MTWIARAAAAWCFVFAAASARQMVIVWRPEHPLHAFATGFIILNAVMLLAKLAAAWVALASARPTTSSVGVRPLAAALWAAFCVLALYSAGNLYIMVATLGGLMEPSAAWEAAGGVTARALAYVSFFLVGMALYGVLAASFQRRHAPGPGVIVTGLLGAPAILAAILLLAPRVLRLLGLFPS